MKILSPLAKFSLSLFSDKQHWKIPFGSMKGVHWCFRAANPGQAFGRYESEIEAEFVQLISQSSVFWDVGANVGWFSMMAAKLSSTVKVVAFEPDADNLQYLQRHKKLNNFKFIDVVPKALGSTVGEARFNAGHQQGALSADGDMVVSVTTADDFITAGGLAPDFVKLDIEGGETDFLDGASILLNQHQPSFLLSAHGYQKRDQCRDKLIDYGYQIKELVNDTSRGDYVMLAWASNA